ncbi:protein serine/threonine phosphatase 2C [Trametes maxima]|nr:protein serine/threonine phosphatase 2C [Trametes maxima]
MYDPREVDARRKIKLNYKTNKSSRYKIDMVTFQPRGMNTSEDRISMEKWTLSNQEWLFLGVFDGHIGNATSDYTAKMLPAAIRRKLSSYIRSVGGRLDRSNIAQHQSRIASLLHTEIEKFDKAIGASLQNICPRPQELDQEAALRLIEEHKDIVDRAFAGTTVAFALVNVKEHFLWAAGLGDSSVGLSTIDSDGRIQTQRLCDFHTFKDSKEYFRLAMSHSTAEQPLLDWENRVLGWLSVGRAIGDFSLKLHSSYLDHLFRYALGSVDSPYTVYIPKILTPPYILSEPSVRFTDLQPYWGPHSKLFLFTDGVDNLVDGWIVFTPRHHSGGDPVDVVGRLLSGAADPEVERILGHQIDPRWSGEENNRALDVMGNLLGGKDVQKLEMVTDMELLNKKGWPFHIDDVSIIVWPLNSD